MSNRFESKSAIITGAARGMGYEIAKQMLEEGGSVSLWDFDESGLNAAVERLSSKGKVIGLKVDVSNLENVEAASKETAEKLGGIDILVTSAGIAGPNGPVETFPAEWWHKVMAVNLGGVFNCCRSVVPFMRKNDYGRIVNVASVAGKEGNPNASAYSASKAGVLSLTKSLGKELAQTGIRVNAITPAVIKTEMLKDVTEEQIAYMLSKIPMGRMGTVEEVAKMALFLSSEDCSYSTAAVFDMTGGRATY
ncbi:SDR family NAD(P)-dependent oxidoreductase [Hirschia litorea]|uniref:SDR family NAD(P)-dependent oxidoreductase n=1 Tax=Hirschia litorea TaxID=1199156 RepID=A0ABW2IPB3_9PROT